MTNANIQSYGGSEKIAYSLGLGYYDESGILKGSGFNRIDLNSSMNIIPVDKLTVDLRLNASLANRKQGYGSFSSSFQSSPMIGVVPGTLIILVLYIRGKVRLFGTILSTR